MSSEALLLKHHTNCLLIDLRPFPLALSTRGVRGLSQLVGNAADGYLVEGDH